MSTRCLLHVDREQIKNTLLAKIAKTEDQLNSDVTELKSWLKEQNLPEIPCNVIIETFLIMNKFNIEKTRNKLKMYYEIRWEIPELYVKKNPKYLHMKNIANTIYWIPLPRLTPEMNRVTIMKIKDVDPKKFNAYDFFSHTYNVAEIRIREDLMLSNIFVYDLEGIKFSHFLKLSPDALKKSSTILEKVFSNRVAGIHYLNLPRSMEMIIKIVKIMLKEKLRNRIHIHQSVENLYYYLPKDVLPPEYGGTSPSLSHLHELWMKKMDEYQDIFDHLEQIAINGQTSVAQYETSCSKHNYID